MINKALEFMGKVFILLFLTCGSFAVLLGFIYFVFIILCGVIK